VAGLAAGSACPIGLNCKHVAALLLAAGAPAAVGALPHQARPAVPIPNMLPGAAQV